jgi:cobalt transport protein ATP-binding subunit
LLGANGAGKSTLFFSLNGIFKPESGQIMYGDQEISYDREDLARLRSEVVVVLQNPDDQIFSTTVEEDVAFGPLSIGLSREETEERIEGALFAVGMAGYRKRSLQQLSYGQRKRVALAGALAVRPKVMIWDEPTAGLDPQMSKEVMELADQLHRNGTSMVISTHDLDLAYSWADEIHVLREGRLVYSGESEGFYRNKEEVHLSGLTLPPMFDINVNITELKGVPADPYPKITSEMLSKIEPNKENTGSIYLIEIENEIDGILLEKAIEKAGEGAHKGVFGIRSRKYVVENGIAVDYYYSAIEMCLTEALLGKDTVLCCDRDARIILEDSIVHLKKFGTFVNIRDVSS